MKILLITPVSVTIELENNEVYYSSKPYDIYLDGAKYIDSYDKNVFTIYNLLPGTYHEVKINEEKVSFETKKVSEIYFSLDIESDGKKDVTEELQALIDNAKEDSLIIINKGVYAFKSLKLKSNITLEIKKGAILSASTNIDDYKDIPDHEEVNGKYLERGSWEGVARPMKLSMINFFDCDNTTLVGEGIIDGNAQKSTWWIDVKHLPYVRPHLIYINNSTNINLVGLTVRNSPQWTIHPYFVDNLNIYSTYIENPYTSPNTDGIDPEFTTNCNIIGIHISVGDDCIAIKSGKVDLGKKYKRGCSNVVIRNCLMEHGHGAIVLGSEIGGGVKDINISRCIFKETDRGLRIKTRRGRGKYSVIDDIVFDNIIMEKVFTPFTANMFYFCDPDGKTEYVWSKEKLQVDDRTPYLGKFTFKNIKATLSQYAAGYFYGLPEMPIEEINIIDSVVEMDKDAKEGTPVMMTDAEVCSKCGFIFRNVNKVNLHNVTLKGQEGEAFVLDNVKEFNND